MGNRINISKDITIGEHVWIGANVSILKGCKIPNNSVIGTGAIVTKKFEKEGICIAGNPAKVVKEEINWTY